MSNSITVTAKQFPAISKRWLHIGVWSLAIAGLFSLVLVAARTPSLADTPLFTRLFHQALVVHVDLSVLVWFLSIACMFWSLLSSHKPAAIPYIEEAAQICFALGMLAVAGSVFDRRGEALMSNYIPVIMSPTFFLGLMLLCCGVICMIVKLFTTTQYNPFFTKPLQGGIFISAVISLVALVAFFWSYRLMPKEITGAQYYEMLFWAGGHVLQFTHTQMLVVCWLWLAYSLKKDYVISPKVLLILFTVDLLAVMATPLAFILFDITSSDFRQFFTTMMMLGNGIAPVAFCFGIVPLLWKQRAEKHGENGALWSALFMSVLLFIYGGVLAEMISGQNVGIPAHYHGSIVGITLAFMGAAYLVLPHFGYKKITGTRLAFWQPIVYGGGQLMHISGLAWSGGYGVLRKTPGAINEISPGVKAAMGLMGLGGVIAITGGLLFVVVMYKAMRKEKLAA